MSILLEGEVRRWLPAAGVRDLDKAHPVPAFGPGQIWVTSMGNLNPRAEVIKMAWGK
jgi:hypothetical protein